MSTPTIHTPRLTLRALYLDDAPAYAQQVFSDEAVMRYMSSVAIMPRNPRMHATGYILDRQHEWRDHGFGAWAVTRTADGAFMGHVGLFYITGTQTVEIGYALGQQYWGQGYATEAGQQALRFGFETANLDEIVAVAFPQNVASLRVMAKLGMRSIGITDRYYNLSLACYVMSKAEHDALTA